MAFSRTDEVDLLTALHEGPHETSCWSTFLARLQRRTRADHVALLVAQAGVPIHQAVQWHAGHDLRTNAGQPGGPAALDPTPYHRMRPDRVYSATELIDPQDTGHVRFRREYLERIGVRYGRFMRIATGGPDAWLTIMRAADDFGAAESALMSALAPHLKIALRTFTALERARFRESMAEDALVRAGIGWTVLDRGGRTIEAGGTAVGDGPGAACAGNGDLLAVAPPTDPLLIAQATPTTALLSRSAPKPGSRAADALRHRYGLTSGEARLAIRLARGESIAEAAASLGLTVETARNYSKRVFGKTETRSQADLVRLILTGVVSLA